MKKLLQNSWNGRALDDEKFCRSLLQYCNTPSRKDGLSPAQKLLGHPVQDILPAHRWSFLPQWQRPVQLATQQAEDTSKLSAASTLSTCQTFMLGRMLQYKIISLDFGTFMG